MSLTEPKVEDIYGDQVQVEGRWYHAQRIFGRPVSSFVLGMLVPELAKKAPLASPTPDEWLQPDLFRESGANITMQSKVDEFFAAMKAYGGWGEFPPVSGYINTLDEADLERYEHLKDLGHEHELGWSRPISQADLGRRYPHLTEGHHRCHAALRYHLDGCNVLVPIFDLAAEEQLPRYVQGNSLR